MTSTFGKLSWKDFGKGLITAVITSILTGVYTSIQAGVIPTTFSAFQPMLVTGGLAGLGYLLKNLGTNSQDQFLKSEPIPTTDAK